MIVTAIKTPVVHIGDDLRKILADSITELPERSVVVVASKIASLCEARVVDKKLDNRDEKHELVRKEAEWYLEPSESKYDMMLTVKRNWLYVNAGIDESNSEGKYTLWPSDPQKTVNEVWQFLREHFGVKELGVTMADSRSFPLNWGVIGHAIAHCGFKALRDYRGTKDVFGREMIMEQFNVMQGVTQAAALEMGEGNEQTPIGLVSEIGDITFQDRPPTDKELSDLHIELVDDAYEPVLRKVKWKRGNGGMR